MFVRNSVNVSAFEDAGHPEITHCGNARPLFTGFRAAFIDMLYGILNSGCPVGPGFKAGGIFDDMVRDILKLSPDGSVSAKDAYAYITENITAEEIDNYLSCSDGRAEVFTYRGGDGINELQIFRNLTACYFYRKET